MKTTKRDNAIEAGLKLTVAPRLDTETLTKHLASFSAADRKAIADGVYHALDEALQRHTTGGASPEALALLARRLKELKGSITELEAAGVLQVHVTT